MRGIPYVVSKIACSLSLVLSLNTTTLSAQSAEDAGLWMLGQGLTYYELANASGTGIGLSLFVHRHMEHHLGVEFIPTLILRANGFRTFVGLAGDLGMTTSWHQTYSDLSLGAGLSALTGVDGSGGQLARGGVYLSGQGNLWLTKQNQLGLFGRLTARLWLVGHISEVEYGRQSPSASGGNPRSVLKSLDKRSLEIAPGRRIGDLLIRPFAQGPEAIAPSYHLPD